MTLFSTFQVLKCLLLWQLSITLGSQVCPAPFRHMGVSKNTDRSLHDPYTIRPSPCRLPGCRTLPPEIMQLRVSKSCLLQCQSAEAIPSTAHCPIYVLTSGWFTVLLAVNHTPEFVYVLGREAGPSPHPGSALLYKPVSNSLDHREQSAEQVRRKAYMNMAKHSAASPQGVLHRASLGAALATLVCRRG